MTALAWLLGCIGIVLLAGCGAMPTQAGSTWQNPAPAAGIAHPSRLLGTPINRQPIRRPGPPQQPIARRRPL